MSESRSDHTRRERREVSPLLLALVRPLFRYSRSRQAFVLRAVGRTRGPVLRVRGAPEAPVGAHRGPEDHTDAAGFDAALEDMLVPPPVTAPAEFRHRLRTQLLALRPGRHRPAHLWALVAAAAGAGALLLGIAAALA